MPLAPLARTVTVSLVDMQPSESSRSKLTRVAGAQRRVEVVGRHDGVGGDDHEHRGQLRARACRRPWPSRRSTSRRPRPRPACCTESVVMIASAASGPPSAARAAYAASTPASRSAAVVPEPDQPGRADDDVDGADAEVAGDLLGDRVRRLEPLGAGVAVGAAGVEDDRPDDAVLDHLLAPEDRVGLAAVGGEHGRRVVASGRR